MKIVDQGVVFAGEKGTERQSCAFPGICVLPGGRWLCGFRGAPTKGASSGTVYLCVSDDMGGSWTRPGTPFAPPLIQDVPGIYRDLYLTALGDEQVLATICWVDNSDPSLPYYNEKTEGLLSSRIFLSRSRDGGESWSDAELVDTRPFTMPTPTTGPVLLLANGDWALQFELNKDYYDTSVWRHSSVIMFSRDGGRTWPEHSITSNDPENRIFYWDQRPGVLKGGRILDPFWTYDNKEARYLTMHARESHDHGRSWSEIWDTGIPGQPAQPVSLPDGRIVLVYVDRTGAPVIKARTSSDGGRSWPAKGELVIHSGEKSQSMDKRSMEDAWAEMGKFSIGLPATAALPGGEIAVVWYAGRHTDHTDIRWARIAG